MSYLNGFGELIIEDYEKCQTCVHLERITEGMNTCRVWSTTQSCSYQDFESKRIEEKSW